MTFNFNDYQAVANQSTNDAGRSVGFFKLKDDGDEALIRFNISSTDDLQFAAVHTMNVNGKWMKVSCTNPFNEFGKSCALCNAQANGNNAISKSSKKVYLQALVAYKDLTTGSFSAAIPVIWERPAGFSKEIANNLRDYGNLRDIVLKVTRNGAAGDMKTSYSISFVPIYNNPELVPVDFSAFNNFRIEKHSYWEKSVDEINTYLTTGAFPEVRPTATASATTPSAAPAAPTAPAAPVAPVAPAATVPPTMATAASPVASMPIPPVVSPANETVAAMPTTANVQSVTEDRPTRNFSNYAF